MAYIEDLMQDQVRRGHDVSYFFSGRQYPYVTGPRLRRWERDGVAMLEVVNSPLYDHGRQPELELDEPRIERMFGRLIHELRPEVVHVQELAGLPSSVLDVARDAGIPTVLTLQDYFALCPTFKLLDAEGNVCLRHQIGGDCVATTAAEPSFPGLLFEATLRHDLPRLPVLRTMRPERRDPRIERISRVLARRVPAPLESGADGSASQAASFQARRDVNVERLNRVDRLIAMSARVTEIHGVLGVDANRVQTMQLTLAHMESLRPRQAGGGRPVIFATLGGLESVAKGGRLMLDALGSLADAARTGRFRLLAFGHAAPAIADEARVLPGVELRGGFRPGELDGLLDEVDVGIMPSIWEEAYGYAGMEFLAKGIPVIGNAIGGIVEYTREGETGWLNRSCTSEELARIMSDVIERPEQVAELNGKLLAARGSIVKPMADHGDEMDVVYREVIAG